MCVCGWVGWGRGEYNRSPIDENLITESLEHFNLSALNGCEREPEWQGRGIHEGHAIRILHMNDIIVSYNGRRIPDTMSHFMDFTISMLVAPGLIE